MILTVVNIIFTMVLTILIVGLSVGLACADPQRAYYGYYGELISNIPCIKSLTKSIECEKEGKGKGE